MPRIAKTENNIVEIPISVSVNKLGYVYVNTSTEWVDSKNGTGKHADHKKQCIGMALHPGSDWKSDRRMYANESYYKIYGKAPTGEPSPAQELPAPSVDTEYPERSDCISVGLYSVVKALAGESQLLDLLTEVFGSTNTELIMDLAMYMLSARSAVFQHYPHWAKSHALFSESIRSDSFLSDFEKEEISVSRINLFKKKWACHVLDDGRVFVCYDSTNVNSQAEGIFIVQKGHAKDDPDKDQVNTEYTIRQRDGMPVTFKNFPGSLNDMSEASDMITELKNLQDGLDTGVKFHIIMIADRGYVSEENITEMRNAGLGFILMLRKNMGIVDEVLDAHVSEVKMTENYDEETGRFGLSFTQKLFEDDKQDTCFHIVWDGELERKHRDDLMKCVAAAEHRLQNAEKRHTRMTKQELDNDRTYFDIHCHEEGTLIVKKRGRGAGEDKEVPSYVINSFTRNREAIDHASSKCGYMVLVSSEPMSAKEAMLAMSRRDCVEKTFRALKSSLGMDKMGVHFEPSLHTKSLIWFVASILHALIFSKTEKLRVKDRKRSTVPALVEQYEEITAGRDLTTGTYQRRYKLTKMQRQDLAPCGVSLDMIDQAISGLPGNARNMPRV